MSTQFITDSQGQAVAVVLDIETYRARAEAAEDVEDTAYAQDYTARKLAGQLTPDELEIVPLSQLLCDLPPP